MPWAYNIEQLEEASTDYVAETGGNMTRKFRSLEIFWAGPEQIGHMPYFTWHMKYGNGSPPPYFDYGFAEGFYLASGANPAERYDVISAS